MIKCPNEVFTILEAAAVAGERCPKGHPRGPGTLDTSATTQLALDGKIKVEIFPHNFRRVTILTGPNAGKATADPPNKNWRPYKVIGEGHKPTSYTRISP